MGLRARFYSGFVLFFSFISGCCDFLQNASWPVFNSKDVASCVRDDPSHSDSQSEIEGRQGGET